jgi:heptosyltransferase-3
MTILPTLADRPRILVIVLQRIGDVLLSTALVRALRRARPDATIDMLVFAGTEGILAGNGDIASVVTLPQRPSSADVTRTIVRLWRRYHLAVSTQVGDRPTLLAFTAGRQRAGIVARSGGGAWWKRRAVTLALEHDPQRHRVAELMALAHELGATADGEVVPPEATHLPRPPQRPYAVLHAHPMFRYRRWTDRGWLDLAQALLDRGVTVVATGGRDPAERDYLDRLWNRLDAKIVRLDGKLTWQELTGLLQGAAVYVAPDTSVTHLAAACGCPTVALYGPINPLLMGPWPVGGPKPMWQPRGTIQRRGNAWVVQNPLPCLPCEKLGCDGHLDSRSQCLDELTARQVLLAVDEALTLDPAKRGSAGSETSLRNMRV